MAKVKYSEEVTKGFENYKTAFERLDFIKSFGT